MRTFYEVNLQHFPNLQIQIAFESANPLLEIYPRKTTAQNTKYERCIVAKICKTQMFIKK
jgi:hypothetical protein